VILRRKGKRLPSASHNSERITRGLLASRGGGEAPQALPGAPEHSWGQLARLLDIRGSGPSPDQIRAATPPSAHACHTPKSNTLPTVNAATIKHAPAANRRSQLTILDLRLRWCHSAVNTRQQFSCSLLLSLEPCYCRADKADKQSDST
jgi:hypothetical protein